MAASACLDVGRLTLNLSVTRAPQHGENTEEVPMEFGMEWEVIERLKAATVIN
jgi:hypothetical protein